MSEHEDGPEDGELPERPGIDDFQQLGLRWAVKAANGEALVAVVSTEEVAVVVEKYMEVIDDLDNYGTAKEQKNFMRIRDLAVWRVNELVFQGAIEQKTVDSMSQKKLGKPFPLQAVDTSCASTT